MNRFSELFGLALVGKKLTSARRLDIIKLESCNFDENDIDRHQIDVLGGLDALGGLDVKGLGERGGLDVNGLGGLGGLGVAKFENIKLALERATNMVEVLCAGLAHDDIVVLIIRSLPNNVL
jgi:hypothetical protein